MCADDVAGVADFPVDGDGGVDFIAPADPVDFVDDDADSK